MDKKWWYLLGFLGIIAFSESDKNISMSGVKQRRSKRLYFISNDRTIPHDQVDTAKRMARAGYGKIHAVWANSADEARGLIRQGKAETLGGISEKERKYIAERYPIRPAILVDEKDIYVGKYGDLHSDINDSLPDGWWNLATESGWVDQQGNWLTRGQASRIVAEVEKTPIDKRSIWQGHSAYIRATAKAEALGGLGEISKEYWQMTAEEYLAKKLSEVKSQRRLPEYYFCNLTKRLSAYNWKLMMLQYHKDDVQQALLTNKIVPEKVLAEYPDLKPKTKMIPEKQGQMTLFGEILNQYTILPYEMTNEEWDSEINKASADYRQSNFTKRSGSEETRRMKRIEFLYGNTPTLFDSEFGEFERTRHRDIVLKAMAENRDIPEKVLNENADLKNMSKDELDNEYLNRLKDKMGFLLAQSEKYLGSKRLEFLYPLEEMILPLNPGAKYKLKNYIDKEFVDGIDVDTPQGLRTSLIWLIKLPATHKQIINDVGENVPFLIKKPKAKMIPEKQGQMTLFGGLGILEGLKKGQKVYDITPEELTQLDFDVPQGGSSITPKRAFKWKAGNEEYETLYSWIKNGDSFTIKELLVGYGKDIPNTLALLPKIKANKPIKIYRAIEKGFDEYILPGAYVTESKAYAKQHGERSLNGEYVLVESEVKPSELMSYGDTHEFIYIPESAEIAVKRLRDSAKIKGDLAMLLGNINPFIYGARL